MRRIGLLLLVVALAGCGGEGTQTRSAFTGSWAGTATRAGDGIQGPMTMVIKDDGSFTATTPDGQCAGVIDTQGNISGGATGQCSIVRQELSVGISHDGKVWAGGLAYSPF